MIEEEKEKFEKDVSLFFSEKYSCNIKKCLK
jgi:hypothetical protein